MPQDNKYDIQLTVIIYKKKYYISHIAALALAVPPNNANMLLFGNRILIEVAKKDMSLISQYPIYDLDSMLKSFIEPATGAEVYTTERKACFVFDGMSFVSLSKLKIKNKYNLRFSLPTIKIFGTYYILCGKQKDVNTRIIVKPE